MIRVLQFADVVNRYDFIDNIVQWADPDRFEIGVCARTADCNIAEPEYPKNTPRWILPGLSRSHIPRTAWRLARILREWKPQVLHVHHYDQAVIGWLATRLQPSTRLVIGRHYSDSIYRSTTGPKRMALLALEHVVNRSAARIVVPSSYIWEILSHRQRIPTRKLDRVPYGFVSNKYVVPSADEVGRIRDELGIGAKLAIGNFARLHEEKGQRYLIDAVARLRDRLPNLRVLLVGDGPERLVLERQVTERQLQDFVKFLGWRKDAMTVMAAVDVVVQPTLQEAFSQVMAEALWMSKPLIMTDVSGASDVITHAERGLLVPKADSVALALAIERLAGDEELRLRLGQAGRAYVEEQLTIQKIMPLYERVYERALEN